MIDLGDITCCPRCRSMLSCVTTVRGNQWFCTNSSCSYFHDGFINIDEQPVLIDFDNCILTEASFVERCGRSPLPQGSALLWLKLKILRLLFGSNTVAKTLSKKFLSELEKRSTHPRVLIIGGGTIGSGADALYNNASIELVGTDIYASQYTMVVADGHKLPFIDESFDGVWIQAVLEHVLDPPTVVAEIYRVLRPSGIVFADTPFMQQVHGGAYDFTRFSLSGHRWLFRNFTLFEAGVTSGAGTALVWSLRYLVRALSGSNKMAFVVSALVFWLRFFDGLVKNKTQRADAAGAVYFFGQKATTPIRPHEMVSFYSGQNC